MFHMRGCKFAILRYVIWFSICIFLFQKLWKKKNTIFVPQMCIYCCPSNSVWNISLQNGRYNARHLQIQISRINVSRGNIFILRDIKTFFIFLKKEPDRIRNVNSILNKKEKNKFDSQNSANVERKSKAAGRTAPNYAASIELDIIKVKDTRASGIQAKGAVWRA